MKTVLAATLCLCLCVVLLGPYFSPVHYCEAGRLNEDRGPLFGKHVVIEVYQGVALVVPCAPGQMRHPKRPKEIEV